MAQDWYTRLIGASAMQPGVFEGVTAFLNSLENTRWWKRRYLNEGMRESPAYQAETARLRARGIVPVRERRRGFSFPKESEPVRPPNLIPAFHAQKRGEFRRTPVLPPTHPPEPLGSRLARLGMRQRGMRAEEEEKARQEAENEKRRKEEEEYREKREQDLQEHFGKLAREGEAERARIAEEERVKRERRDAFLKQVPRRDAGPPIRKPKPDPRYPQKPEKKS